MSTVDSSALAPSPVYPLGTTMAVVVRVERKQTTYRCPTDAILGVMGMVAEPEYPPVLTAAIGKTLALAAAAVVQADPLSELSTRNSLSAVVMTGSLVSGLLIIVKVTA
eukprot:gene10948-biopygen7942